MHHIRETSQLEYASLLPRVRSLDIAIVRDLGEDPYAALENTWHAATIRRLILADGEPVAFHFSRPYAEHAPDAALWSMIPLEAIDRIPVAFARHTRAAVAELWQLEPPQILRALSIIPAAHARSLAWHRRVIRSHELARVNVNGHEHAVTVIRRPQQGESHGS